MGMKLLTFFCQLCKVLVSKELQQKAWLILDGSRSFVPPTNILRPERCAQHLTNITATHFETPFSAVNLQLHECKYSLAWLFKTVVAI